MNLTAYIYKIQSLLQEANKILIVIGKEPNIDAIASGLAFYLSLTQKGKQVTVICPSAMTVEYSDLYAVNKISDNFGKEGKNLIISFPYVEGSIEKVSYNIENNRFNLVIEPRGESYAFEKDKVEFTRSDSTGFVFDAVFTIAARDQTEFGQFQNSIETLIANNKVINIDNDPANTNFGFINVIGGQNASIAEITTLLLSRLSMPLDKDIASNLFKGIKSATNNFSNNTSADSFEAAAICTRLINSSLEKNIPIVNSMGTPTAAKPQEVKKTTTPPDWLKPKIFRSGSNLSGDKKGTIL